VLRGWTNQDVLAEPGPYQNVKKWTKNAQFDLPQVPNWLQNDQAGTTARSGLQPDRSETARVRQGVREGAWKAVLTAWSAIRDTILSNPMTILCHK
jgi:hypothetical protein